MAIGDLVMSAGGSRRRADARSLIAAAVGVAVGAALGPTDVEAQERTQLGTIISAGRVTYFAARTASSASWTVSVSGRRRLRDGRWDSAAVDVARRVWSTSGGRVEIRAVGRHDRLKGPHGAAVAAEASWKATRRVTVAGNTALSLHESSLGGGSVRFRSAVAGARVRLVDGLAIAAAGTLDARGHTRVDLFVYGVR